jgi:hypothetical protein
MAAGLTIDDAMQAVFEQFSAPDIEPDEFTERMYADRYGMPSQTASRQLNAALKAGMVTRRWVLANGKRCWGYRPVTD